MPTSLSNKTACPVTVPPKAGRFAIIITMGDPSGIGPEVTLKSLASPKVSGLADFLVIGDKSLIDRESARLGLRRRFPIMDLANVPRRNFSFGIAHPSFGRASLEYINEALRLLKKGKAGALVTSPVSKRSIELSGLPGFTGHTEYLASRTRTKDYAMMFVGKNLKVVLVTRHIALKDVPAALSMKSIYKTIIINDKYLKSFFKIRRPRIGVAGLNPHSSEGGLLGVEEKTKIIPAIRNASRYVIFHEALNGKYDAVIAMYHDQGLIPFKMLYFNSGVNLTLGLPFVRTSPDHGTAFDIAGKGMADPRSMMEAILLAHRLSMRNVGA